jgi:hypothetical protein
MTFFDPEARLDIHRGKLPHWRQEGVIYFVTFRLADSLPQAKLDWLRREKELWLGLNPGPRSDCQQRQYDINCTASFIPGNRSPRTSSTAF